MGRGGAGVRRYQQGPPGSLGGSLAIRRRRQGVARPRSAEDSVAVATTVPCAPHQHGTDCPPSLRDTPPTRPSPRFPPAPPGQERQDRHGPGRHHRQRRVPGVPDTLQGLPHEEGEREASPCAVLYPYAGTNPAWRAPYQPHTCTLAVPPNPPCRASPPPAQIEWRKLWLFKTQKEMECFERLAISFRWGQGRWPQTQTGMWHVVCAAEGRAGPGQQRPLALRCPTGTTP